MSVTTPLPITVVMITKNEEANIFRSLSSVSNLVSEIILVDGHSTDATVAIARQFHQVKVIPSEWLGYVKTKELGIRASSNDWILWLDADEEVSPDLEREIRSQFAFLSENSVVGFPRQNMFLNHWVRYAGWYPDVVYRLFNRTKTQFVASHLHETLQLTGARVNVLKTPLKHYSYQSVDQYFAKMMRYGEQGALDLYSRGKKPGLWGLVIHPWIVFVRCYFLRRGFLNGIPGIIISMGSAFSSFVKYVYLMQHLQTLSSQKR